MLSQQVTYQFNGKQWNALMSHCYKSRKSNVSKRHQGLKFPILSKGYLYFTDLIGIVRVYVGIHSAEMMTAHLNLADKILVKDKVSINGVGINISHNGSGTSIYRWTPVDSPVNGVQVNELFDSIDGKIGQMTKEENSFYSNGFAIDAKYISQIAELAKSFSGYAKIIPVVGGAEGKNKHIPTVYVEYIDMNMLSGQAIKAEGLYAPYKLKEF